MAPSKRLINTVGALGKAPATPYICVSCRSTLPSHSSHQARHNSDIPFTEKLRRKIWGTDNPPGLKDPYGGPSFLERRIAQRKGSPAQQSELEGSQLPLEPESRLRQREAVVMTDDRPVVLDRADPRQYKAPVPQADDEPTEYKPAETWENLEWVGDKGEYQFQAPSHSDGYQPWLRPPQKTDAGRLTEPKYLDALHESIFDAVQPANEGYDRDAVIHVTSEGYVARAEGNVTNEANAFETAKIDFKNPEAPTFKILKNFQKVTNIRLPDPTINKLSQNPNVTFRDLFVEISREQKPKPTTTHAHLQRNRDLAHQRNVHMSGSKITPVHKERKIGREKVVRKELEARGLVEPRGTDIIWARITKSARQRRAA